MKRVILAAASVAAVALSVAACGPRHAGAAATFSASAHAFATSSQGQQDKMLAADFYKKCVTPHTVAGQLAYAKALVGTSAADKAARAKADTCAGITDPAAFDVRAKLDAEAAFKAAAKAKLHHDKGVATQDITTLVTVTIPNDAVKYGAHF